MRNRVSSRNLPKICAKNILNPVFGFEIFGVAISKGGIAKLTALFLGYDKPGFYPKSTLS
jgi:hypothetical protein